MPTVQTYGGPKVDTAPLPGVRLTAAETPESQGAQLDRANAAKDQTIAALAGQGAAFGTAQLSKMWDEQRQQADEAATLAAATQLQDVHRKLLFGDPEAGTTGALGVLGRDAMALPDQVQASFTKAADAIEAGLATPNQQRAFQRARLTYNSDLNDTVSRHVFEQMRSADTEDVKAHLGNNLALAGSHALDPVMSENQIADGVATLTQAAPRLGLGTEALKQQVNNFVSAGRTSVMKGLLANGRDAEARAYFGELGDQILGDQHTEMVNALRAGTVLGEAQRRADDIIGAGGGLSEWETQAKQIPDAEVRQAVTAEIEHQAAINDRIDQQNHDALLMRTFDKADQGQRPNSLDWAQLKPNERSEWLSYFDKRTRAEPVTTDPVLWSQLYLQATSADPQQRAAFMATPLPSFLNRLAKPEFEELTKLKGDLQKGDTTAVRAPSIDEDQFKQIAQSAGLHVFDPASKTPTEQERLDTLRFNVKQAIDQQEATNAAAGRKTPLSFAEKGAVMSQLIDRHVMLDIWGTDPSLPAAAVIKSETDSAYVPLAEIPKQNLAEFGRYVRSVSPATAQLSDADLLTKYTARFQRAYAALVMHLGDAEIVRRLTKDR